MADFLVGSMRNQRLSLLDRLRCAAIRSRRPRLQRMMSMPFKLSKSLLNSAIARSGPVAMTVPVFWGDSLKIVYPEQVSVFIDRYGFFEEGLTRFMIEFLKPGMTFVDVGAHFGYVTRLGSFLTGKTGKVFSFEPTPSTFAILRSNTEAHSSIQIENCAAFMVDAKLKLTDFGIGFSAFNSIAGGKLASDTIGKLNARSIEVDAINLDRYLEGRSNRVDMIKIDAEGAEDSVLQGLTKTLTAFYPAVSMEVGDENDGISKLAVERMMEFGYKLYSFNDERGDFVEAEVADRYFYDNLFFLHPLNHSSCIH